MIAANWEFVIDTHPPSISDRRVGSLDHTFALVVGGWGLYAGYESYIPYSGILCTSGLHTGQYTEAPSTRYSRAQRKEFADKKFIIPGVKLLRGKVHACQKMHRLFTSRTKTTQQVLIWGNLISTVIVSRQFISHGRYTADCRPTGQLSGQINCRALAIFQTLQRTQ